ncbi:unnamed protein product [Nippostrongylus brasiliensis]|uniref:Cytochrome b-c1 complex subunit Rieske, mitochondrial n=2 Tax=Nippostrongylus brasiliensis TaxID=27835 RepID=A0A158R123_NIPBR|nr:unnamed protein product [Nippostrongylus brasiliensis]
MSNLARSGNVATKVICGAQYHVPFVVAASPAKVTPVKDVVTEFKNADSLQDAASRTTNHGHLLSSNFAFKGINVTSRRLAHTDVKFPDMSNYRREVTLDANTAARDTEDQRRSLAHAVYYGAGGVMSLWAAKESAQVMVVFKAMAADQRALASIEVNMNEIPEGVTKTYEWRGKPVFVKHRTKKEIAAEKAVNVSELRHAEHDDERVQKPEWSVVIGVCTHLGCVPIANAGDYGGYFCPCHGSHYDGSGRIRKGPAPLNLHVPAYTFKDNVIVIGSS